MNFDPRCFIPGPLAQQKRSDHQPIGRLAGLRVSSTDVVRIEKLRKWPEMLGQS